MIKIKLYGCPICGSEFTEWERFKILLDNLFSSTWGYTCQFCTNREPLEYLGKFNKDSLYKY